jgi:drug/metabolite transporter (DMT)-like permease
MAETRLQSTSQSGRRETLALMIICSCLWASGFLFMRLLTGQVVPEAMAGARASIAFLILSLLFTLRGDRIAPYPHEWKPFIIIGTLNGWLPNILTAFALTQISTASSAMIQASGPLMVAVLAHFMFAEERLTRHRLGGVLLGFLGMGLLIGPVALMPGSNGQTGFFAMTGVAVCYAFGSVYTRRVRAIPPLRLALGQQLISTSVALPLTLALKGSEPLLALADHWVFVLALGSIATAVPISLFMILISKAGPTRAAMVGYLMPVFATTFSILFLNESVGMRELCGGAVILTGIWLATSRR